MQTYQSKKTVKAVPMTRLKYNEYRGWELPEDEDGSDEGYLVEYVDGGQANHPDHEGYISWSPKDVFDKSHKLSGSAKERLVIEIDELSERLEKLKVFLASENSEGISEHERALLLIQSRAQESLLVVLEERLKYIKD